MNFLTTPVLYGLGAVAVAAGIFAGVQTVRLTGERADHAETKAEHAAVLTDIADKTRIAAQKARKAEQDHTRAVAAIGAQYEQEKADALSAKDGVIAGLAAGSLRLREQWRCPDSGHVPGTPAGAAGRDGTPDLRAAGAGDLVRIGKLADAQVRACQAVVVQDRASPPTTE